MALKVISGSAGHFFPHIVLGAGSAGAIIATRLSEDPQRSVLLLEAGPDYPDLAQLPDELKYGYATATDIMVSDHNWQFVGTATAKAPPMLVPRGKVTGGSSAINGQVFLRGVPEEGARKASLEPAKHSPISTDKIKNSMGKGRLRMANAIWDVMVRSRTEIRKCAALAES